MCFNFGGGSPSQTVSTPQYVAPAQTVTTAPPAASSRTGAAPGVSMRGRANPSYAAGATDQRGRRKASGLLGL